MIIKEKLLSIVKRANEKLEELLKLQEEMNKLISNKEIEIMVINLAENDSEVKEMFDLFDKLSKKLDL